MRIVLAIAAVTSLLFCGCRSAESGRVQGTATNATDRNHVLATRNNSASLLHQLLSEERHIGKLLIIKRDREELADVIKRIADTAGKGVQTLEAAAATDATLKLKSVDLPRGEQAARDLQSDATTKELLKSKGKNFEFKLLMSQAQALGYAASLAAVVAANEPDAARRNHYNKLQLDLAQRHAEVVQMLRH